MQAHVQLGDDADHKQLAGKVLEAQQNINRACGEKLDPLTVPSLTSDEGYYSVSEMQVIADPVDNRHLDKLKEKKAVQRTRRSVKSKSGKTPLRRRGMHIERSFAHILDCGMRQATLRGWKNLNKRYKLAAAFYSFSHPIAIGKPADCLGRECYVTLFPLR